MGEFRAIDANNDKILTYQEICRFLDEKQGYQFDRGVAQDLFRRMDRDRDNTITTDEFVQAYAEMEDQL